MLGCEDGCRDGCRVGWLVGSLEGLLVGCLVERLFNVHRTNRTREKLECQPIEWKRENAIRGEKQREIDVKMG